MDVARWFMMGSKPTHSCSAHTVCCQAHHLRELVYVHDSLNEKIWDGWAKEMMDTLLEAKKEVDTLCGPLMPEQWFDGQWLALLARGEHLNSRQQLGWRAHGQAGPAKAEHAVQFAGPAAPVQGRCLAFRDRCGVPFTNNLAEQALRMFPRFARRCRAAFAPR